MKLLKKQLFLKKYFYYLKIKRIKKKLLLKTQSELDNVKDLYYLLHL